MPDGLASLLGWVVPAAVVFGVTAIGIAVLVWGLRRARVSPRAQSEADAARAEAGVALVRLDDALEDLDIEVGLSGALYGGNAPASLRRARLTAQRVRQESFEQYRVISEEPVRADEARKTAVRIRRRADEAVGIIASARTEHDEWVRANVSAADQVAGAQRRLERLRATMGDTSALVAELRARFAADEWQRAAAAATAAEAAAADAGRLLDQAQRAAGDPTQSALGDLAAAERALRRAEVDARTLEETHRMLTQAAQALPGEFDAARTALRQARGIREQLEPDDAERLGGELRAIDGELTALETDAARRPARTVDRIARLRDRLDLALGDARTAQQRLRGARSALPGTLAAARGAVARAEASAAHTHPAADARVRLAAAQRELAAARQAADPVEALDAARRAMRHAEDSQALADYDRLTSGGKP